MKIRRGKAMRAFQARLQGAYELPVPELKY